MNRKRLVQTAAFAFQSLCAASFDLLSYGSVAIAAQPTVYSGPDLPRTDWVVQNGSVMGGSPAFTAVLMSNPNNFDAKAGLGYMCIDGHPVLMLTVMKPDDMSDFLDQSLTFVEKVGDDPTSEIFGTKVRAQPGATIFILQDDKLSDRLSDGTPIFLRFSTAGRVFTLQFVPNNTEEALAPLRSCHH